MIHKTRLFTPGPTPLLPAAQFAMAAADIHHRTPEFRALFSKVLGQLKVFVGTENDVLLLSCSGTGAMEASVSNVTSPGDRVLVLTAGKFGERWVDLAKAYGVEVDVIQKPYGQTFDLAEVQAALKPEHKAVYMQASETSTGASHDVEGVAALVKGTETLLVVDGITGLGTQIIDVDAWGVDIVIGGSQKAVMIPPDSHTSASARRRGRRWRRRRIRATTLICARSARIRSRARRPLRRLSRWWRAWARRSTTLPGRRSGDLEKGRIALIDNAQVNAAATRAGLVALGFTLFAPTSPSAAATAVAVPEGMDSGTVVKALKAKFRLVTANGQGTMQGKIFRVAHLGFFDQLDTIAFMGATEVIAKDVLGLPVKFGQGVAAAQEVFAKAAKN